MVPWIWSSGSPMRVRRRRNSRISQPSVSVEVTAMLSIFARRLSAMPGIVLCARDYIVGSRRPLRDRLSGTQTAGLPCIPLSQNVGANHG